MCQPNECDRPPYCNRIGYTTVLVETSERVGRSLQGDGGRQQEPPPEYQWQNRTSFVRRD